MSEKEIYRQLDIGGGTDTSPRIINNEDRDKEELMSTESLRAVKLAQANPGGQYFILDPELSTSIANRVSLETPNVHFIQGVGEGLPVADASIDAVEINHLFYPVHQAEIIALEEQLIEKVAARRIQIVQDSADMISGSDIDFKVDEYRRQLIQEAEKGGEHNMMVLESEDSTIEDFQKYMNIISEASRTLKADGKLIIAEKKQRIDVLVRILSNQSGKKFLHDNGLTLASVEANTQQYRSRYAEFAAMTNDIRSARGLEPQSGLEPFVLTFEKKGITLIDQPAP